MSDIVYLLERRCDDLPAGAKGTVKEINGSYARVFFPRLLDDLWCHRSELMRWTFVPDLNSVDEIDTWLKRSL